MNATIANTKKSLLFAGKRTPNGKPLAHEIYDLDKGSIIASAHGKRLNDEKEAFDRNSFSNRRFNRPRYESKGLVLVFRLMIMHEHNVGLLS